MTDGLLVVDKPAGWTSHDVVARVRRLTGEQRVGHAGTLDPAATGVLPVAVGDATKTLEHLGGSTKSYLAEITFGVETDSDDIDGRVVHVEASTAVTEPSLADALSAMEGEQWQMPPMYAAIKVDGRRLYELARAGQTVERALRPITIDAMLLIDWRDPVATVWVECSKGTYVRSIARDLGARLGCGAYLSNLTRTRSGPFTIECAWTLTDLAQADLACEWESIALHPDSAFAGAAALLLDSARSADWSLGRSIDATRPTEGVASVYDRHGDWLGIGVAGGATEWQPRRVVAGSM